jgi:hypothetical protein
LSAPVVEGILPAIVVYLRRSISECGSYGFVVLLPPEAFLTVPPKENVPRAVGVKVLVRSTGPPAARDG